MSEKTQGIPFGSLNEDEQAKVYHCDGSSNAAIDVPLRKFIGDVSGKVVNLADIYRVKPR